MAIKVVSIGGSQKKFKAVKEFTDREEPRNVFRKNYNTLESSVIIYYGAGGVGKTALLKELQKQLDHKNNLIQTVTQNKRSKDDPCKYIFYDFNKITNQGGIDRREVLNNLKKQLTDYGCGFPLFELGDLYYLTKSGSREGKEEDIQTTIDDQAFKNIVSQYSWLKGKWNVGDKIGDILLYGTQAATTATDVTGSIVEAGSEMVNTAFPMMKVLNGLAGFAKKAVVKHFTDNNKMDKDHAVIADELEDRFQNRKTADDLYDYLPILFAQDVRDWIEQNNEKLVVFFDTYELLLNNGRDSDEKADRDLWLRGDEVPGIMLLIPNVLWVIAGRRKLKWTGTLKDELDQYIIKALDENDSSQFLKTAGITDPELRHGIYELTQGYPLYLDLCVDVYAEYKNRGEEPKIEDFGQKQQDIFNRLVNQMDAATQDMIKFLCVLGSWTDEIAKELGRLNAISNFSDTIYEKTKNFSFMQYETVTIGGKEVTAFKFDRTLQGISFEFCDDFLRRKTKETVNTYFGKFFSGDNKPDIEDNKYYIDLWADLIIRLSESAEELLKQYEENFERILLLDWWKIKEVEASIIKKFFDEVKKYDNPDELPYTYFEQMMARVKLSQGEDREALELGESAYKKIDKLFKEDNKYIIMAIDGLARIYYKRGDTLKEIEQRKKIVEASKKIFGKTDEKTINYMEDLAESIGLASSLTVELRDIRLKEELNLRQQIYDILKEKYPSNDERIANEIDRLAWVSQFLKDYQSALFRRKQYVDFYENQVKNDSKLIEGLKLLVDTLRRMENYEEELKVRQRLLNLYEKTKSSSDSNIIECKNEIADIYDKLDQKEEAERIRDEIIDIGKRNVDEVIAKHTEISEEAIDAISDLSSSLSFYGRNEEAKQQEERIIKIRRQMLTKREAEFNEKNKESVVALLGALEDLQRELREDENEDEYWSLKHRIAKIRKKICDDLKGNPNADPEEIIHEMNCLAFALEDLYFHDDTNIENYENAVKIRNEIIDLSKVNYGDHSSEVIEAMEKLAVTYHLVDTEEELNLMNQIVDIYKDIKGKDHDDTIRKMEEVSDLLVYMNRPEEALKKQEEILELTKQKSGNIARVLKRIIHLHDTSGNFDKAFKVCEQLLEELQKSLNALIECYGTEKEYDVVNKMDDIASAFGYMGLIEDELKWRQRIFGILKDWKGEDAEETIKAKSILEEVIEILRQNGHAIDNSPSEENIPKSEIDTYESISLRRGQKVPIAVDDLSIVLNWQTEKDIELDASAFMLNVDGKASSDEDFIFYNNAEHSSGCIEYLENGKIKINLSKVPAYTQKIAITLTSYDEAHNFSQVDSAVIRLIDTAANKELMHFESGENLKVETAVVIGEFYRYKGAWKFNAVGAGFKGGLETLCKNFGVEVND